MCHEGRGGGAQCNEGRGGGACAMRVEGVGHVP